MYQKGDFEFFFTGRVSPVNHKTTIVLLSYDLIRVEFLDSLTSGHVAYPGLFRQFSGSGKTVHRVIFIQDAPFQHFGYFIIFTHFIPLSDYIVNGIDYTFNNIKSQ